MSLETVQLAVEITSLGIDEANSQLTALNNAIDQSNTLLAQQGTVLRTVGGDTADIISILQQMLTVEQQTASGMASLNSQMAQFGEAASSSATGVHAASTAAGEWAEGLRQTAGMLQTALIPMSLFEDGSGQIEELLNHATAALFAFGSAAVAAAHNGIDPMTIGLGAAAAVILGIGAAAIDGGSKLEDMGTKFQAVLGVSQGAIQGLQEATVNIANQTGISFTSIGDAYASSAARLADYYGAEQAAAMGAQVMADASTLAVARGEDVKDTMAGITDTMLAFGVSSTEAMNVLYNAGQATGESTETLAEQIGRLTALGGPFAQNLQEDAAFLVTMSDAGLEGGRAIQQLGSFMANLADPSEKFLSELSDLGIAQQYLADVTKGDLQSALDLLSQTYVNSTQQTQENIAVSAGAATQQAKFGDVMNVTAAQLDNNTQKMGDQTAATQAAAEIEGEFSNRMAEAGENVKTFLAQIGVGLIPVIEELGDVIGNYMQAAIQSIEAAGTAFSGLYLGARAAAEGIAGAFDAAHGDFADMHTMTEQAAADWASAGQAMSDAGQHGQDWATDTRQMLGITGEADAATNTFSGDIAAWSASVQHATGTISDLNAQLANLADLTKGGQDVADYGEKVGTAFESVSKDLEDITNMPNSADQQAALGKVAEQIDDISKAAEESAAKGNTLAAGWKDWTSQATSDVQDLYTALQNGGDVTAAQQKLLEDFASASAMSLDKVPEAAKTSLDNAADQITAETPVFADDAGKLGSSAIDALNLAMEKGAKDPGLGNSIMDSVKETLQKAISAGVMSSDQATAMWQQLGNDVVTALGGGSGAQEAVQEFDSLMSQLGQEVTEGTDWDEFSKKAADALNSIDQKMTSIVTNYTQGFANAEDSINGMNSAQDALNAQLAVQKENEDSETDALNDQMSIIKAKQSNDQDDLQLQQQITDEISQQSQQQQDQYNQMMTSQATSQQQLDQQHRDRLDDISRDEADHIQDVHDTKYKTAQEEEEAMNKAAQQGERQEAQETINYERQKRDLAEKDTQEQTAYQTKVTNENSLQATKISNEQAVETEKDNLRLIDVEEERINTDALTQYKILMDQKYGTDAETMAQARYNQEVNDARDTEAKKYDAAKNELDAEYADYLNKLQQEYDAYLADEEQKGTLTESEANNRASAYQASLDAAASTYQASLAALPVPLAEQTGYQPLSTNLQQLAGANGVDQQSINDLQTILLTQYSGTAAAQLTQVQTNAALYNQVAGRLGIPGLPVTPNLNLPGYASGTDFTVGGSGSGDSTLVAFMATPGERVQVNPNGGGIDLGGLKDTILSAMRDGWNQVSQAVAQRPNNTYVDGTKLTDVASRVLYRQIETKLAIGGTF